MEWYAYQNDLEIAGPVHDFMTVLNLLPVLLAPLSTSSSLPQEAHLCEVTHRAPDLRTSC